MDFGLSRFNARLRTRRLDLPEITADGFPTLVLIIAELGAANPAHYSWIVTHAAPDPATIPADGTPERRDYNRRRNVEMLGAAAIVGWENVLDAASGQPAPCTPENATDFMAQLLENRLDVFDQVFMFAMRPEIAKDAAAAPGAVPPTDPVDLGKG